MVSCQFKADQPLIASAVMIVTLLYSILTIAISGNRAMPTRITKYKVYTDLSPVVIISVKLFQVQIEYDRQKLQQVNLKIV